MPQSTCLEQFGSFFAAMGSLSRLPLTAIALFVVFGFSMAGMVALPIEQSRSHFEIEAQCQQELEEAFVKSRRRLRSGRKSRGGPAGWPQADRLLRLTLIPPFVSDEGHRLSNGVLAPMTC